MLPKNNTVYAKTLFRLGKQANEEEHTDWAKAVLDKALTHHTTAGLIGASVGALAGKKGKKLKSTLAGAGIGTGASFVAPELSSDINESIVKHLVRQPVGRVLTNVVEPFGYQDPLRHVKSHSTAQILGSILSDKPLYSNQSTDPEGKDNGLDIRDKESLWRTGFDLKSRHNSPNDADSIFRTIKDKTWTFKNPEDGSTRYGTDGKEINYKPLNDLQWYINEGAKKNLREIDLPTYTQGHMSGILQPDGTYKYKDKWDFDLHPGEHISQGKHINKTNLARYLLDKLVSPVTVEGTIKPEIPTVAKTASILVKMKQAQSVPVMADVIQNGMSPEQRTDFATRTTGIFNKAKDIQAPAPFNNFLGHNAVKRQLRGLLGGLQENNPDVINSLADSNKQNELQSVFDVNPRMYADVQKQFKNVVSPPLDTGLLNNAMRKGQDFSHAESLAKTASLVSSLSKGFKAINPFKRSSNPAPIPPFGGEPAKEVTAPKPAPQVQSPTPVQQPVEQPQRLSQQSRRNVMGGIAYQPQQPVITDNSFDAARAADVLTRNVPVVPNTPSNPNVIQTPLGNIDKHNMPDAISKLMPDEIGAQGASWKLPDSNTTFNAEPMKGGLGVSLAFNTKF